MINLTATTESNPQTIATWKVTSGNYWWQIKCVAWISQNGYDDHGTYYPRTTIKYKWQVEQFNYYPFWNDVHTYRLSAENDARTEVFATDAVNFALPQSRTNGTRDLCTARTLGTVLHRQNDGTYSGNFHFEGAKCWETFNYAEACTLPTISPPSPEPEPQPTPPEPEPPAPIDVDDDPHYYIYADDELVYGAGIEGYEILNPKLNVEVNKAGSLTFDIPVGSEMYNKVNLLKTTVEARQGNTVLFRGRVLNTQRNMTNTISYYCEGFLSWLNDIVFQSYSFNGQARDLLKRDIERYNSRATTDRQITYEYSDISANITVEQKNDSTGWDEVKKVLIDGVGGYVVPYLTSEETGIQWLSTYGASTSQVIQFGENLLDFSEYIDASKIFTAVRAYGKEINGSRVTLSGNSGFVQDDEAISIYGRIERTAIFDEITTESALRKAALDYLRTGLTSAITISIKAVDLHLLNVEVERISIGDSVRVVSVPHSVDAYFLCTKITYDFAHPKNTTYTFGSTQRTISELTDSSYNKYVITEGDA